MSRPKLTAEEKALARQALLAELLSPFSVLIYLAFAVMIAAMVQGSWLAWSVGFAAAMGTITVDWFTRLRPMRRELARLEAERREQDQDGQR